MNESVHLSKQFDEDLAGLRTHVLEMGGLVESQIRSAVDAYATGETGVVKDVVENDHRVNEFEKLIDDHTIHIVAKRQPTASDLRLVMGVTKIVTDLERIGDEAKKIAKGARRVHEHGQLTLPRATEVRHVASEAVSMLRRALDAFARLDVPLANEVIHADAKVDAEFKALVRQLITYMMEDPRTITTAIDIVWICRSVERIGDHAKNIAEHVINIAEGRDVRHTKDKEA
ncbi:MAG: phosphate signaling complex protein PhoU [Rhodocyclaceae bacterium]|uniref:phosphate signaling complex protein PhoU n=1 Tax=Accumulibacter sp. TaxID=2053492 RepID=UPI002C5D4E2E|nr:phosphate signaling complex protein PhoU [Accumulibacter sp.]HNJ76330.1 phosphate signaling complex protein PhoU [Azospira sp.]HNN07814.1 phosphate signaling complex protein PhoU [Azospira sp.]HNN85284.1 phosphate signaling complex protein PhoU [Accumulibacter sp.]